MFRPDQPIESKSEDILGRTPFAQAFGQAILDYRSKESLVLGLFGEWGSGKSSIINLALEHIRTIALDKPTKHKPTIVHFNPWNYSNQNQLISQFFRELSLAIRGTDHLTEAKVIGRKLEEYAKLFEPLAFIPKVGPMMWLGGKIIGSSGRAVKAIAEAQLRDLDALKGDLNQLLEKQQSKVIIVIDDIDRLPYTEIGQMFQLVKSLADFRNTVYILAFDKAVVVSSLNRLQDGFGFQYMEKVIQVPFEIPLMPKDEVLQLLFARLDEMTEGLPQERWDEPRWGNVFLDGMKDFFTSIRDVNRYMNAVTFGFGLAKAEVNTVDFLAITAIQVFAPESYYVVRENKGIFTGVMQSGETEKERTKLVCEDVLQKAPQSYRQTLKELLKLLFPKLEAVYGNVFVNSTSMSKWRRDRRISSPEVFDTFFRLAISKSELSRGELESVLATADDADIFSKELNSLNENQRITRFLERLEDYTDQDISQNNITNIVAVLINLGDNFPEGDTGFLSTNTSTRILRICYQLTRRLLTQEQRLYIYKSAIERANNSLYIVVDVVSFLADEHEEGNPKRIPKPEDQRTVSKTQLDELKMLACGKIESWATDGRLMRHRELPYLLYHWKRWADPIRVQTFVHDSTKDDAGLLTFVSSFVYTSKSQGLGSYFIRTHWHINAKGIAEFTDLKAVELRVRSIASSHVFEQFDEQKKRAVTLLLDTVDGKLKDPMHETE